MIRIMTTESVHVFAGKTNAIVQEMCCMEYAQSASRRLLGRKIYCMRGIVLGISGVKSRIKVILMCNGCIANAATVAYLRGKGTRAGASGVVPLCEVVRYQLDHSSSKRAQYLKDKA